jgi:hypothetical protein
MAGMITKCPKCGNPAATVQAKDITEALSLAKDGRLRGYCVNCDLAWNITEEEHKAKLVRNLSGVREHTHHAQVGDLHLETWTADGRFFWSVTNIKTRQQLSAGEANTLDAAKIQASGAAGVRERQITWRGIGPPL